MFKQQPLLRCHKRRSPLRSLERNKMKFNPKKNRYKQKKPATFVPSQEEIWNQAYEIRKKRERENPEGPRIPPNYGLRPGYEIKEILPSAWPWLDLD